MSRFSRWGAAHGNRDANEAPIVAALRALGAVVVLNQNSGRAKGTPDLTVGFRGRTELLEVKLPGEDLSPSQRKWWDAWKGAPPHLVHNTSEALAVFGVELSPRVRRVG